MCSWPSRTKSRLPEQLRSISCQWSIDELRAITDDDEALCPCHNDLLPANLIDDGQRIRIIDWEYAGMGNRFFDLGNFAENHELSAEQEQEFLHTYFGREEPNALPPLRAMRKASSLREATWGFAQAGISRLDFDFRQYAEHHLQRFFRVIAAC